jgi:hypothetical protein
LAKTQVPPRDESSATKKIILVDDEDMENNNANEAEEEEENQEEEEESIDERDIPIENNLRPSPTKQNHQENDQNLDGTNDHKKVSNSSKYDFIIICSILVSFSL